MARGPLQPLKRPKVQRSETLSDLDLYVGAGDGNRTRTISLRSSAVRACHMA
jgi:hypothetical protein